MKNTKPRLSSCLKRTNRDEGTPEAVAVESEEYYNGRPVGSRLGAWASEQSKVVAEDEVHNRLEEAKARFSVDENTKDAHIPLPDFWGGWRVVPE